ncbi:MAG: hypothetical protein JKX84_00675 [Flavobacteriales bacterium]|nr:hypothetical protein [Flavobacteriales bacterium]
MIIIRNILAVLVGIGVGGVANLQILKYGALIIPPPEGLISGDMESLKEFMPMFGPEQFVTPFLAHAIGTLVGAWLAAMIAASHQMKLALGIGIWFFAMGIIMSFMLPAPLWFTAVDSLFAYIPMGWLGWKLAGSKS